jgi:hypothetical protein
MTFAFLLSVFVPYICKRFQFCAFSAPNGVAPTNFCENECCFSILRVIVFALVDDDDGLFSNQHAIRISSFYFLFFDLLIKHDFVFCGESFLCVGECGNYMLFLCFCADLDSAGDGDDLSLFEKICNLQIFIYF